MGRFFPLVLGLLSTSLTGCHTKPPAQEDVDPTPPSVRILKPTDGSEFTPQEIMTCELEVTAPEGGRVPDVLKVKITTGGGKNYGTLLAKPKSDRGSGPRSYEAELKLPKPEGDYRIHATSIYYLPRSEPRSGGTAAKDEAKIFESPAVKIKVRAR